MEYPVTVHAGLPRHVNAIFLLVRTGIGGNSVVVKDIYIMADDNWKSDDTCEGNIGCRIGERAHHGLRLARRRMSDRPVESVYYEIPVAHHFVRLDLYFQPSFQGENASDEITLGSV